MDLQAIKIITVSFIDLVQNSYLKSSTMTIESHKDGNKQTFGTPNHEIYQSNNIYMSNKIESKLNKSDKLSKYSIYIRH